jgi:ketosteroid isomerase-like protein
MPIATELRGVVAEFVAAVNAFDLDRIVATFTPDAYVNDVSREMWGTNAIRAFIAKEIVGDHVTMELVLTSYFGICDDKITSLTIIANQPSPY